ncbi:hypothetical protein ACET9B_16400 [Aeromonas veronii]
MLKGIEPLSRRDVLAYSLDSNWEVMTIEFPTATTIDLKPGACVDANGALVVTGSTLRDPLIFRDSNNSKCAGI